MVIEYFFFSLLFFIGSVSSFRVEPLNVFNQRKRFYSDRFVSHTNNLAFEYAEDVGYYCIAKSAIKAGDEILEIPIQYVYSVFENFPLKDKIYTVLKENEFISRNLNLTSNILLTTRLMFDLKANVTETFILMKRFDKETFYSFSKYKEYLKSRHEFFFESLKNLPIANIFGQTSWSEDDINEYEVSGFLPVFKNTLIKIFRSILEDFSKDEILNKFTQSWFNEANLNYFLSLYGYVISRGFKVELSDTLIMPEDAVNKDIKYGTLIIPFIELCNHYHPRLENFNVTKALLKQIKLDFDGSYLRVKALSDYKKGEEFSFTYSSMLTNDFLLLNYGFVVRDNPFQEFVFKFDVEDPEYKLYTDLKKTGFSSEGVQIMGDEKLSIHFPLSKFHLSDSLQKFIEVFVKLKVSDAKMASLSRKIRPLTLYYLAMERNVASLLTNAGSMTAFFNNILENFSKKQKLVKIINENTQKFVNERGHTEDDDIQNLFYFKTLHDYVKKCLISRFNLENLKILFSQENLVMNRLTGLINNDINKLKKNYI